MQATRERGNTITKILSKKFGRPGSGAQKTGLQIRKKSQDCPAMATARKGEQAVKKPRGDVPQKDPPLKGGDRNGPARLWTQRPEYP